MKGLFAGSSMDATPPALNAYDHWVARRQAHRRLCAAGGEDRLSTLPDDVLRLILCRLDTRSALTTAALSKHWARLPRELPVLEFNVVDVLPESYHWYLQRRRLDAVGRDDLTKKLDVLIGRYERQSMRLLASALRSFVNADNGNEDGHDKVRRRAQAMTLKLFPTHNPAPFDGLITRAINDWGVQQLEVVVLNSTSCREVSYSFPHNCFQGSKTPGLKALKLSNCAPFAGRNNGSPSGAPRAFSSLTVLVLQGMPKRPRLYQRVIRACPMLEVLHLKSCLFKGSISVDAPDSRITELVIEACTFRLIELVSLPRLERLAWVGTPVEFFFGSMPRLTHLNLNFYHDPNAGPDPQHAAFFGPPNEYPFSKRFEDLENLVVRFTMPDTLVAPGLSMLMGNLRHLLVVDVPRRWDLLWITRLLVVAPFLETLHVHVVDHDSKGTSYGQRNSVPPSSFKHRALTGVVISGLEVTGTHLNFVKFLKTACKALENILLLKHGHVRDKGLWDWEIMALQVERRWTEEERNALRNEIEGGDSSSLTPPRIIFG